MESQKRNIRGPRCFPRFSLDAIGSLRGNIAISISAALAKGVTVASQAQEQPGDRSILADLFIFHSVDPVILLF
ncbi:hypothetical protein X777_07475 [Ooceraea biroi]|uniref:Uncharacterized protein n=1 Tax=Ooceraea biroi TaxID=2015173 RepID=A0A026X309_OOCBI|nr:hypothetical protein X777_07475 [Ooceraea biroi]